MIVYDGTAPGVETRVAGPGLVDDSRPQHDVYAVRKTASPASPESAASGSFVGGEWIPGRSYVLPPGATVTPRGRSYRPGEVEEIAVAAVVREALWALIAKRDPLEMPIEALVDEAAMAAGKVMARALAARP